ncbi:hypothetical protein DAETH_34930 (plasmid) [Deinococcus aetherius]|uniref:VOC domain-containing protein n=1 Tax=Deinococcus aetherius TaxID=200252 RepID=A0ABN6RLA3_9DEIO|nr:VOC family protein [Deinococcus aetherius]BDP43524.1 hypothetical protein DAETH_34930 [Deinococcus aetherius]
MPLLEHVALKALDLGRTQVFYEALGANVSRPAGGQRLFATFDGRTRLIFDQVDFSPDSGALTYLGLELASFDEVDALFTRLATQANIHRDMREEYSHATGPYGFFVLDPDGYVVKVFKYNATEEA